VPASCVFHPLDLEIIDLVYEVAWTSILARDPYRDPAADPQRRALLRKQVFAAAVPGSVDFDPLLDKVLASLPETWITHVMPSTSPFARSN
jgi:hypothetical protein